MTIDELLRTAGVKITPAARIEANVVVAGFKGQYQGADNWCWAAIASTVADCYANQGHGNAARRSQCQIVHDHFDKTPKCENGPTDKCPQANGAMGRFGCVDTELDRQGFLNEALDSLGILEVSQLLYRDRSRADKEVLVAGLEPPSLHVVRHPGLPGGSLEIGSALDFEEIKSLIRLNRPVCLRLVRRDRRHFIILYGFEGFPDNDVLIWDPAKGDDVIDFDRLVEEYGPFTHKLVTCPPGQQTKSNA